MNTDLPLINSEDDKLGRFSFATEIAEGLVNSFRNNNESIVLGINGNWGSGKSTLINFIVNEVERISFENECEIITLRFNPWMFSGQKELQNIFLKEMFQKLESNKEKLKDASKKIVDFLGYLNWLKYVHSGVGEAVEDAKIFLEGINKTKDLNQLKKEIDNLLIESNVKLYITIDDIDRLTPSEITDIFQLVKLNGNFANTIFILAYDQKIVGTALNQQFGDNGKKYIEKIVQVDYTIPPISNQNITRIFINSLIELFPDGDIRQNIINLSEKIKTQPFINFFSSLRDIYRFNNSIKLRLPSIHNELNIIDFLLVESLRIFNYEAYEFIIQNKESLICKKNDSSYVFQNNLNKDSVSNFINDLSFKKCTLEILKNLFTFVSVSYIRTNNMDDLIREKRVSNSNYFDRYFNLQLSSFDVQEITFDKFINGVSIDDKVEILKKIMAEDKLFSFLNWVEIKSIKSDSSKIEKIICTCFKYSDSIKYNDEYIWGLDSDLMTILRFISKIIKRILDLEKKRELILNHLSNSEKEFSFSSFFVADQILQIKYLFDDGKSTYNSLWHYIFTNEIQISTDSNIDNFFDQVKESYISSCKILFKREIDTTESLNEDELICILNTVKKYHEDFYYENFHFLIANDNDLIKYVWMSIKGNYMTSTGMVGVAYQLTKKQFFSGMDTEEIKLRFDKINKDNLDKDENKVVELFLKAYEDGFVEKKYYNIETLIAIN